MRTGRGASDELVEANVLGKAIQILRDELKGAERGEAARKVRPFITISREFGCEGTDLAVSLTGLLNQKARPGDGNRWMYYDKGLLDKMAEDFNLKKEIITAAEERSRGVIEQYLSKELSHKPDDWDVFQYLVSAITTLASRGNVILVGRGASILTQGMEHGFHVRLYASQSFKMKRIRECMPDIAEDPEDLSDFIEKEEKRKDSFVERFTLSSPRDRRYYHLLINNNQFSVPQMAEAILGFMGGSGILRS